MTDCTERVFTKVISGLRDKHEDKDWLKTVSARGPALLSNLNIVLFDKNPYVSFVKLLTQFFGLHIKLSSDISNAVYMGSLKCINALGMFYEIQQDFGDKLGFGDIDAGQNDPNFDFYQYVPHQALIFNLSKLLQSLNYYLGHLAYQYIKIDTKTQDEKNSALQLVVQSNLLS